VGGRGEGIIDRVQWVLPSRSQCLWQPTWPEVTQQGLNASGEAEHWSAHLSAHAELDVAANLIRDPSKAGSVQELHTASTSPEHCCQPPSCNSSILHLSHVALPSCSPASSYAQLGVLACVPTPDPSSLPVSPAAGTLSWTSRPVCPPPAAPGSNGFPSVRAGQAKSWFESCTLFQLWQLRARSRCPSTSNNSSRSRRQLLRWQLHRLRLHSTIRGGPQVSTCV
jgi:hypothetical protein